MKVYETVPRLKNSHHWCEKKVNEAAVGWKTHQISIAILAWFCARLCSTMLHKFPLLLETAEADSRGVKVDEWEMTISNEEAVEHRADA